jgi:hypothetical protein
MSETLRTGAVRAAALLATSILASAHAANTLVPSGTMRYAPTGFPDRIVALPAADPARGLTVAWRTDAGVSEPLLQVTEALDSPDLADHARDLRAQSTKLESDNGLAQHHYVRIDGLKPDTLYAYRVQGRDTWSEWIHHRTAAATARPFAFLYLGDAQNSIKSLYSRVLREAWRREPQAALALYAGDFVNGRDDENDIEWGEWFDAGGFIHSSMLVVPAPGNHEHDDSEREGRDHYTLGQHWPLQFPVPTNGAPGLPHSTYWFDYQDVRFIVLDSTSALKSGTAEVQANWLRGLLADNPNRWTVVMYHHPVFSVSLDRDNPELRDHWLPLFERYDVDLVLQGHDHVYGRGHAGTYERKDEATPVYVVSVSGPKQYRVSDAARRAMTRHAENTQLYQIVRADRESLRYESWTVAGDLYDAFDLVKTDRGVKRLVERSRSSDTRRCPHAQTRSGRKDRCWDGTEW